MKHESKHQTVPVEERSLSVANKGKDQQDSVSGSSTNKVKKGKLHKEEIAQQSKDLEKVEGNHPALTDENESETCNAIGKSKSGAPSKEKSTSGQIQTEPKGAGLELTGAELKELENCEVTIMKGKMLFLEVGAAFEKICQKRLYRETHGTFDEYCVEKWDMTDAHARRLIDACKINAAVTPIGAEPVIKKESHARALKKVAAKDRCKVLSNAKAKAGEGHLTVALIEEAAAAYIAEEQDGDTVADMVPLSLATPPVSLQQVFDWAEEVRKEVSTYEGCEEVEQKLESMMMALRQWIQSQEKEAA